MAGALYTSYHGWAVVSFTHATAGQQEKKAVGANPGCSLPLVRVKSFWFSIAIRLLSTILKHCMSAVLTPGLKVA